MITLKDQKRLNKISHLWVCPICRKEVLISSDNAEMIRAKGYRVYHKNCIKEVCK